MPAAQRRTPPGSQPALDRVADATWRAAVRKQLANWYGRHARDLPWRRTRDPYHIWVSEIMLQQTQVVTVVRYFNQFIERFPTVADLAVASEADVLQRWQGLGYYARARNLLRAARTVVDQHDGVVPRDEAALRRLPGIGRYVAGAIRSFAFGEPAPILEANTARVLCRLFGLEIDLHASANRALLWQLAEALTPIRSAARYNQSIMELGALVCVPTRPECSNCPIEKLCQAAARGIADRVPLRKPRTAPVHVHDVAAVIWHRGRVLVGKRPSDGRWGGLWEFPRLTLSHGAEPAADIRRSIRTTLGLAVDIGEQIAELQHSVMHYRVTLTCFEACLRARVRPRALPATHRWVRLSECVQLPFSAPQRRLLAAVQARNNLRDSERPRSARQQAESSS